jgi:hypothetical protein
MAYTQNINTATSTSLKSCMSVCACIICIIPLTHLLIRDVTNIRLSAIFRRIIAFSELFDLAEFELENPTEEY